MDLVVIVCGLNRLLRLKKVQGQQLNVFHAHVPPLAVPTFRTTDVVNRFLMRWTAVFGPYITVIYNVLAGRGAACGVVSNLLFTETVVSCPLASLPIGSRSHLLASHGMMPPPGQTAVSLMASRADHPLLIMPRVTICLE